jgi:hypothetical protein
MAVLRDQRLHASVIEVARCRLDSVVAVPLSFDIAEIAHEPGPAREPILARDHELRIRQANAPRVGEVE